MSSAIILVSLAAVVGAVPYYAPDATSVNNLTVALTGSGRPVGGIFNSSHVSDQDYGVYNWCNMPHVRENEYQTPSREFRLKYVEVIHRHHKRTPYASNVLPSEDTTWDCTDAGPGYGARSRSGKTKHTAMVQWSSTQNQVNPFVRDAPVLFLGSNCQFPQITTEGLEDSLQHGKDLAKAYRDFLPKKYNKRQVVFRITNNVITSQVASGLIPGMFPDEETTTVEQHSSTFDSLEPGYSCPAANAVKNAYNKAGTPWANHLTAAVDVYAQIRKVTGILAEDSGGFHNSFDHYYDNFSAKQCHGKALPCKVTESTSCISQELADTVYRLGHWEYSHQWRDAPNSALYSSLHYGAYFLELKANFNAAVSASSPVIWRHNVAHDGRMGAEVVFELFEKEKEGHFLRVLWNGQPMKTSTPLGTLDMVPLEAFTAYIDSIVGTSSELYAACHA